MSNAIENLNSISAIEEEDHWISVSDLMAGLMMVFLFISIALMRVAFIERDKIKEVAVAYQQNQVNIYNALVDEFQADLDKWGAEIDQETLSFEFQSPDVLFSTGRIDLNQNFREILNDFFPRYLLILKKYEESINEVRIEGHTSSIWNNSTDLNEAYFNNMALSQGRTRSVLNYVYNIPEVEIYQDWIKKYIAAVGLSSSQLIINTDGSEDRERSRRVSFRSITNAEIQIRKILNE